MHAPARIALLAATLLAAPLPALAAGGGKTHLAVKVNQVVSLSTFSVPNDNSTGHGFFYDRGPVPFSVPNGFSFVVTDIIVQPNAATVNGTERIFALVDGGDRFFHLDYLGAVTRHYPIAGGIVVPAGANITGRNTTSSAFDVDIRILGYFVKGNGLPFGVSPFPSDAPN